jgi:hypothetical protein
MSAQRPRRLLSVARVAGGVFALTGLLAVNAAAVDVAAPGFEAFARELGDLVPIDQRAMFAAATEPDSTGDQYHPSGRPPGITPAESDFSLGASFVVEMADAVSSAESGSGGILNCETNGNVCSSTGQGRPSGTTFHAYAGMMGAPLVPAAGKRLEFGVAALDESPRDGRPSEGWEAIPEFPGAFFQGSHVAWTLLSEDGEPFRLMRLEYGPGDPGFLAAPSDAIAMVRGSAWAILVPAAEWEGTVTDRLYVFRADDEDFAPETSVVDTYPDIAAAASPSGGRPTIAISTAPDRGPAAGQLVAIGAVALVALVGGWILVRRRHRRPARRPG